MRYRLDFAENRKMKSQRICFAFLLTLALVSLDCGTEGPGGSPGIHTGPDPVYPHDEVLRINQINAVARITAITPPATWAACRSFSTTTTPWTYSWNGASGSSNWISITTRETD